jgi:hypothetical protein
MDDYDTAEEYELMAQAGMDARQILASLTTAPAERFGDSARVGRIAQGLAADLVVLANDPSDDVRAFAAVRSRSETGKSSTRPISHKVHPENEQEQRLDAMNAGDDGPRTRGAHFLQRDSGGAYPSKLQLAVSSARYFSSRPRVFILQCDCNLRVGERVRAEGGRYEERKN